MLNQIRSIERKVTPIVLDIYDKQSAASLDMIARVQTEPEGTKQAEYEWWDAFPEMRKWLAERTTQRLFQDALKIKIEPFEVTYDMDRRDLKAGRGLARVEDLAPTIAAAFAQGKLRLAYKPLATNAITYDGQNFFDTDHVQPWGGDPASNVLVVGTDTTARAAGAGATTLTKVEASHELRRTYGRIQQNRINRQTLLVTAGDAAVNARLTVITRSIDTWTAFDELFNDELVEGQEKNRWKGRFNLLRDLDPEAGTENSYDVIATEPGGPTPVLLSVAKEPSGLEFDLSQEFARRYIAFGMDGEYGSEAAFWQTAGRVLHE